MPGWPARFTPLFVAELFQTVPTTTAAANSPKSLPVPATPVSRTDLVDVQVGGTDVISIDAGVLGAYRVVPPT